MATRVVTELRDDIDGSRAEQTIRFALDGTEYEIDLSGRNANRLRNSLSDFIEHGRKVGGGRRGARSGRSSDGIDNKAVRAWAKSAGIELSSRGRIPAEVVDRYRQARH
jgi:Lsr2